MAVFGVVLKKVTMILLVNDEVTQMCTSGTAESLIVGTKNGSMAFYDFKQPAGKGSVILDWNAFVMTEKPNATPAELKPLVAAS